jgi:hypothetical protein
MRPFVTRPRNVAVLDMTGQTIGRLRVVRSAPSLGRGARWHCACVDCGASVVGKGSDIRRGRVGCQQCRDARRTAHA